MANSITLGINYLSHDTAAALMVDSNIIMCCEEERYNYQKHTREFPLNAINDCLISNNYTINDVDTICVGFDPQIEDTEATEKTVRRKLPSQDSVIEEIRQRTGFTGKVEFYEHHLCHVASGYYPSGFKDALLISNDGIGEIASSLIAIGRDGEIEVTHRENKFPHSLGIAYAAITRYLGWGHGDEGILMGLASYGDPTAIVPNTTQSYDAFFEKMILAEGYSYRINDDWFSFPHQRNTWVTSQFTDLFGPKRHIDTPLTQHHKNIASGIQNRLENIIISQLKKLKQEYGLSKLCISGGIGLNCSLNGKIEQLRLFDEVFVQPASGDNGICIGACYLSYQSRGGRLLPKKWDTFSLGSSFSDEEIREALDRNGLTFHEPSDFHHQVALHIAEKKIIGWFQGGAEFGPRALGNRSILASPFPADMKDYINARVKFREPFRPFAPAILAEHARAYFDIAQDSPFMLMAAQTQEQKRNEIPAVVHVDESARVQTVREENNSEFHTLLQEFHQLTGCPVLMNTSFNVKGQPIVNNPDDAIKCFQGTNIDVLAIGKFLVTKNDQ